MYTVKAVAHFDSAHFLSGYDGKCSNIHGHRWKIEVVCYSENLPESGEKRGMVVDFSDLKKSLKEIADNLDHALIYESNTLKKTTEEALLSEGFHIIPVSFRPTAENFAKYIYDEMTKKGFKILKTAVYETPENVAEYICGENR